MVCLSVCLLLVLLSAVSLSAPVGGRPWLLAVGRVLAGKWPWDLRYFVNTGKRRNYIAGLPRGYVSYPFIISLTWDIWHHCDCIYKLQEPKKAGPRGGGALVCALDFPIWPSIARSYTLSNLQPIERCRNLPLVKLSSKAWPMCLGMAGSLLQSKATLPPLAKHPISSHTVPICHSNIV